ncbi:MAG TPA: hypothetical protein ENI80_05605 [Acidiferrobacteraceae bacterium]|nr:hypothetical protein [Acidiferrobacteraceae bacterium]
MLQYPKKSRLLNIRKVEETEQDIEKLSKSKLKSFRKWLVEYDAEAWDGQSQVDVEAGNLDDFADEIIREYHAGKANEL